MEEKINQKNVLGEYLETCSNEPVTGWLRDGCCNTDKMDHGMHTVCAKVTKKFLEFAKLKGNDLITPHPEFNFPGLKDGDCWCICAETFMQSIEAGVACKIYLRKTNYKTLEKIPFEKLKTFAIDLS